MKRIPRYRIGDPEIDALISEIVQLAGGDERNNDLVQELITSALRMSRERADRGDLKIASAALKEMRYAFNVFAPYRNRRKASIFGSARTAIDHPLYDQARSMAAELVKNDWMVITGAGPGIMTAGIEGAGQEMAFGVGIKLPFESTTSQFITGDPKLINFRYFFTRKLMFMKESSGFVLMPGGFGTMDEGFELLTLVQTGKMIPTPIVFLDEPGGNYWKKWNEFIIAELLEDNYISETDLNLYLVTDSVVDAANEIKAFYNNYHSQRFVSGILTLRMKNAIPDAALAAFNKDFAHIIVTGEIERCEASDDEREDNDHLGLARLRMNFDKRHWADIRMLINKINEY
ncbi:MAG TPA: TIGR00730 family Rossman fold protein [Acidimicrobiia bacterium]|nr:TIGR00730 family Rossman fold protein [Acidimicrobiia bacterium]